MREGEREGGQNYLTCESALERNIKERERELIEQEKKLKGNCHK